MPTSEMYSTCPGCGLVHPAPDNTTYEFKGASPACAMLFSEVVGREYSDYRYSRVHNLTVDTYAVQHDHAPESPRVIKSVAVHLITLYLQLEQDWTSAEAGMGKQRAAEFASEFVWLAPPEERGQLTIAGVYRAADAEAHVDAVQRWSRSVWQSWHTHHATVKAWTARINK